MATIYSDTSWVFYIVISLFLIAVIGIIIWSAYHPNPLHILDGTEVF